MAVSFTAVGSIAATTTQTLTITAPACSADDILIAQAASDGGGAISAPDGTWTKFFDDASAFAPTASLFWKRATGSGGAFAFTIASAPTAAYGVIAAFSGCTTSATPIDATTPTAQLTSASDTVNYATFDPTETDAYVVACGFYFENFTTAGSISGTDPTLTNRWDLESGTGDDFSLFGYSGSSSGAATGARSHSTTSNLDADNLGVLFGLVAAGGAADPEGSLIGGKLLRGGLLLHGVLGR